MKSDSSLTLCLMLLGVLTFPTSLTAADAIVRAGDADPLITVQKLTAERLLHEGDADGALAIYASLDPSQFSETDHYNQGVALYQSQRYEESAKAFRRAAAASNPILAARARFNLGDSAYARAIESLETEDPNGIPFAIDSLRSAIESYRSALRIDPTDNDARFNIELANKLLRQLEQQQQQQQQQREQTSKEEQAQKNPQEPSGESQEQHQDAEQTDEDRSSDENQNGEPQQSAQSPQANENQEDSGQQPQQQPTSGDEDSEDRDAQPSQSSPPDANDNSQPTTNSSPNESDSQQPPNTAQSNPDVSATDPQRNPDKTESDTGEPNEPQETPDGELTTTNALESPQDDATEFDDTAQPLSMNQEEARKILQSIRDRDMLRRLRRQAAERARRKHVDRDW